MDTQAFKANRACLLFKIQSSIFSEILIQDLQIVLDRECAKYQFVCQCHTVLSRIKLTIIFNTNYQNKAADSLSPLKAKKLYSIHIYVLYYPL